MHNCARQSRFAFRQALALLGLFGAICFPTATLHAQSADKTEKPSRRIIHKADADYPLDLQRAHIGGVVRLVVTVNPAGTVDSISVVGGNPVLVETATRAVKKWKWAPAASATDVRINVNFDADKRNGPAVE